MKRDKAKGERTIFRRFVAFEMTRMAHQGSANAMGRHLSQIARNGTARNLAPYSYDDRAALREAIERKAAARYETDGRPIGLLVYIDGLFHPPHMPVRWARAVLEEKGPTARWTGIWLYDAVYNAVVASWSRNNKAAQQAAAADR